MKMKMPSIRPLKRKIPSLSLFWEKECSWQELLPSSSTINVQRHAHIMLQIFLVERVPAYEFSADLVTRLCCPTTLRFFRQNSVNAGSTVAPLGAEENLLAEFRKGSSLPSCSGLWGSREETSAARYIPFLKLFCACFYFSGVSSWWCSTRLSFARRGRN